MLKIPYQAINKKEAREEFERYIDHLNIPLIDYVAIGVQDLVNKQSFSLKSDSNFQKAFLELELADHDPVRRAIWQANNSFFTFDSLDYGDKMGKAVMKYREQYSLHNGLVCLAKNKNFNYSLTLATGCTKFDGYKFLIENKEGIHTVFNDLKKIADLAADATLPVQSSQP